MPKNILSAYKMSDADVVAAFRRKAFVFPESSAVTKAMKFLADKVDTYLISENERVQKELSEVVELKKKLHDTEQRLNKSIYDNKELEQRNGSLIDEVDSLESEVNRLEQYDFDRKDESDKRRLIREAGMYALQAPVTTLEDEAKAEDCEYATPTALDFIYAPEVLATEQFIAD